MTKSKNSNPKVEKTTPKADSKNKNSEKKFKPQPKTNNITKQTQSLNKINKPKDFVRGGSKGLTPLEFKDVNLKAQADVLKDDDDLFSAPIKNKRLEEAKPSKKSKKKSEKPTTTAVNLDEVYLPLLSAKKLALGTLLLGVIKKVDDLELEICISHQLTAKCLITGISAPLKAEAERFAELDEDESENDFSLQSKFQVGEILMCSVTKINATSKPYQLEVSIDPQVVQSRFIKEDLSEGTILQASILSYESHGIQLDLGIPEMIGFLPKSEYDNATIEKDYPIGKVQMVRVLNVNNRVIKVSTKDVSESIPKDPLSTVASILPGTLVDALVTGHRPNGITVQFMGFYEGHINWYHLSEPVVSKDQQLSKLYKIGSRFNARIIAVSLSVEEKLISLSIKPHLLNLKYNDLSLFNMNLGEKIDNVTVHRLDPFGLMCSYDNEDAMIPSYVTANHIIDEKIDLLKSDTSNFLPSTTHSARIVGSFPFENLVKLSFKPSVVETDYYSVGDLKLGQKVSGTIKQVLSNGIAIALSNSLQGFVPRNHMSDIQLKDISKRYPQGSKVSARVLSLNVSEKKLILTLRKSLVKDDAPIVCHYSDAQPNLLTTGLIKKVLPNGCVVDFFNGVNGFCHISEMSESKIESPQDSFKVGQPIKCKVISVNPDQQKLALTFRTNMPISAPSVNSNLNSKNLDQFNLGDFVNGKIVKAVSDGFIIQVDQTKGFLPHSHLIDHSTLASFDFSNLYPISSTVNDLIVLQKNPGKGLLLSKKQSLISGFKNGNLPHNIQSVKVGDFLVGYIQSIYDYGVFVNFLGDFNAFCFLKDLADVPCTSPKSLFVMNQTVLARVIEIDQENNRAKVSLKPSQVKKSKDLPEFASIQSFNQQYFAQLNALYSASPKLQNIKPGNEVSAEITSKHEFGWRVQFDQFNAILTTDHISKSAKSHKDDNQIQCKILDADLQQKSLDLTTHLDTISLPSELDSKLAKQLAKLAKSKQKISAKVELIKDNLVILSLPDYNNVIAFSSSAYFNSSKTVSHLSYGNSCQVSICSVSSNDDEMYQIVVSIDPSDTLKSKSVDDLLLNGQLVNPIDSTLTSGDDLKVGRMTKVSITKQKQDHLNATLATNIHASIHITQIFDNYSDIPNPTYPLANIKIGDIVDCKITGTHLTKTHKTLSISGRSNRTQVYNLTIKPSELTQTDFSSLKIGQISQGREYLGFVHEIKDDHLLVSLSQDLIGRVNLFNISSDFKIISDFKQLFKVGMAVQCQVSKVIKSKKFVSLSITKAPVVDGKYPAPLQSIDDIQIGQILPCKVKSYYNSSWNVQIGDNQTIPSLQAKIFATNLSDELPEKPQSYLTPNSIIQAYVLNKDSNTPSIALSLREQHIKPSESSQISDPVISKSTDLKEGQIVRGYVYQIRDEYALIALGDKVIGRVQRTRVSDEVVNDINDFLKLGQVVKSKITKIDTKNNHINLSLKLSSIDPNAKIQLNRVTFNNLQVGNVFSGVVKKVESFGLFIKLDHSNLVGLCRKNNLADTNISDLSDIYQVDERVKTKIINVDSNKRRFELGCKASLFEDDESGDELLDQEDAESETYELPNELEDVDSESDSDVSDSSSDSDAATESVSKPKKTPSNPLIVKGGFNWDEDDEPKLAKNQHSDSDDSDSDSSEETRPKKKAKKSKVLEEDITGDLATAIPQVAADYERLLLGSPNSSFLWINYMALQLQLNEIEKARQLANRALDSINIREEQERFNIWIALLNLELKFGDLDQVQSTFTKAVHRVTDVEKLYFQLAKMYSESNHHDLAQGTFKSMCKKFPDSVKIWQTFGEYYMRQGKKPECREVLKKALTSASKKFHLDIISKFGQLEFKYGESERGRTIFEGVVSSHPNRLDLWNIYLDMEIKNGEMDFIRRLFKRAIGIKGLSSKKMKFLFKKFLTFEKEYGDEYSVEDVKNMAIQYVEAKEQN